MKFKVEKGTTLFTQLMNLWNRIQASKKEADELVAKIGAQGFANDDQNYLAGKIAAFYFESKKRPNENWKALEKGETAWFYPKFSAKQSPEITDLQLQMAAITAIPTSALNELLNTKIGSFANESGIGWFSRPWVAWYNDYILIKTPDGYKYEPVNGMTEIVDSQFQKLSEAETIKTE